MAALISQAGGSLLLGRFSDLLGHKWINQLGAILGAGAAALMLFIPNPNWLFPVFILMNLSLAGLRISRMSITMEFGSLDKLPTFVALSNTLLAVPMLLAPVAGGWIIDIFGYRWLFIVAITFYMIGWFMLWRGVQDPRIKRGSAVP
jgi:MFS family permease